MTHYIKLPHAIYQIHLGRLCLEVLPNLVFDRSVDSPVCPQLDLTCFMKLAWIQHMNMKANHEMIIDRRQGQQKVIMKGVTKLIHFSSLNNTQCVNSILQCQRVKFPVVLKCLEDRH
jgi:hypothetical protein